MTLSAEEVAADWFESAGWGDSEVAALATLLAGLGGAGRPAPTSPPGVADA
jgi:hypothetical protein